MSEKKICQKILKYQVNNRNSYEKGESHDLKIPEDLIVEFDAELFTTETGGYTTVQKESEIYQELVSYRHLPENTFFDILFKAKPTNR